MKYYKKLFPNRSDWIENRIDSLGYVQLQDFNLARYDSLKSVSGLYTAKDRQSLENKAKTLLLLKSLIESGEIKILWAENEDGKLKTIHRYDTPELADKMYDEVLKAWSNDRDEIATELTVEIYDSQP